MKKILIIFASLTLIGCATEVVRTQPVPVMVTITISAPRLMNMSEPPSAPEIQASMGWDFSKKIDERDRHISWIYVPICSRTGQEESSNCVPSIGEVAMIPRTAPDKNKGIVDVVITLSNDAISQINHGGSGIRSHQHVGVSKEKISYGVLNAQLTVDLVPGSVRTVELQHGISIAVSVGNNI